MLLIRKASEKDFQQITVEEVCKRFNVPLKKLKENPELLINEEKIADRLGQSRELSAPAGTSKPSSFVFNFEGTKYELKYAEFENEVVMPNGQNKTEYFPPKVVFKGVVQFYEEDKIDLLVYLYLYPKCGNSPFKLKSTIHDWYFKDLEAEGQAEMDRFNELSEAISEINDLSGDALRVVAKAINITYQPFTKDIQIRAELSKKAQIDPYGFNKLLNSNVTRFKGIVFMAVDMGVFVNKPNGQYHSWYWGKGENTGKKVVDVLSGNDNANDILFTHVQANMGEYYMAILSTIKNMNATNDSDKFLENQKPIDLNDIFGKKNTTLVEEEPLKSTDNEFGGGTDEIDVNQELDESLDTSKVSSGFDDEFVTEQVNESAENSSEEDEDGLGWITNPGAQKNSRKNAAKK